MKKTANLRRKDHKAKKFNLAALLTNLRANVPSSDMYIFFIQTAAFYKAGIAFTAALAKIAAQSRNLVLQKAIWDMCGIMEHEGLSLADAMERQAIFPSFAIHSIRAGERSGTLHKVLLEIAASIKQDAEIQRKMKSALLPLKMICVVLALALLVVFLFVMPKFRSLYEDMHIELPLVSKIVFALLGMFSDYWYLLPLVVIAGAFLYSWVKIRYEQQIDIARLRLPIYKGLYFNSLQYRIAVTLQLLQGAGVAAAETLQQLALVVDNTAIRKALRRAAFQVEHEGLGISEALENNNRLRLFDFVLLTFVSTGEESGTTSEMLDDAAGYYRTVLMTEMENYINKIAPLFLIPVTVVILLIMLSIYAPLFTLMQAANK